MSRRRILNGIHRILRRQMEEATPDAAWLSRRDWLKLGGIAFGGLMLPKLNWAKTGSTFRIGIVGAGISGLAAALTLQDHGVPCSIYEASARSGGRMFSNGNFWNQGQVSEWCGEFIDSDHYLLRHLARRFGLKLVDVNAAAPKGSVDTNYFLGDYYNDAELTHDLRAVTPILDRQLRQVGPVVRYDHYTKAGYHFDHLTAYDWIETYVPGGHGSRLGRLLDLGVVTLNGLDSSRQSSLNLILPISSDERFHTQGGNEQIPAAIAKSLPAGTLNLGWRLQAVVANSDKTVTLTFSTPSGMEEATFDFVILALPFSVLRKLDLSHAGFDSLKMTAIRELGYGTDSKLVLQFDARYWNRKGPWPGVSDGFLGTDRPLQSAWDSSRAESGSDGLLTNYTGGTPGAAYRPDSPYTTSESAVTGEYARDLIEQLEQVWPGIAEHYQGLAALSYPTGDPNFLGSYSAYKVGQFTSFSGYEGVPQGNVFFGGEHTSENFQGYMEGGAEEGRRAALQVLAAAN